MVSGSISPPRSVNGEHHVQPLAQASSRLIVLPNPDKQSIEYQVSADFIRHYLRIHDCVRPEALEAFETAAQCVKLCSVMRDIACEYDKRFQDVYGDNTVSMLRITPRSLYATFLAVCDETFQGGVIRWGRIVALFAFGGVLAKECVVRGLGDAYVLKVVEWVAAYCQAKLAGWIQSHGGWDAFISHFSSPSQRALSMKDSSWLSCLTTGGKSFATGIGLVCGAACILTVGAIVVGTVRHSK